MTKKVTTLVWEVITKKLMLPVLKYSLTHLLLRIKVIMIQEPKALWTMMTLTMKNFRNFVDKNYMPYQEKNVCQNFCSMPSISSVVWEDFKFPSKDLKKTSISSFYVCM